MDSEQLTAIRDAAADALQSALASPQPSYSVDGQQVSWDAHVAQLKSTIDWADAKLAVIGGPFEVRSQGTT